MCQSLEDACSPVAQQNASARLFVNQPAAAPGQQPQVDAVKKIVSDTLDQGAMS